MECRDFRKLASRIQDGEAATGEEAQLSKHLVECEDCRVFNSVIGNITVLHGNIEQAKPPAGLVGAVLSKTGKSTRMPAWWKASVAAAAAVVIVLGVWSGGYLTSRSIAASPAQQAELFEMKYLESYPPGSLGETLDSSLEGEADV